MCLQNVKIWEMFEENTFFINQRETFIYYLFLGNIIDKFSTIIYTCRKKCVIFSEVLI